ncbi:MAG: methyltransferase [Aliiglaciecola sp.]
MNTSFDLLGKSLKLYRYPKRFAHPSWQAWDAADELLIEHISSHPNFSQDNSLLVVNDDFGALTTWFADHPVVHVSDSYVAQRACQLNVIGNQLDDNNIRYLDSLSALPKCDWVVIKIPKTLALLEQQLINIRAVIDDSTQIVAAAKAKSIQKSTLALFEKYIGDPRTSLARKKSRLIFCDKNLNNGSPVSPFPTLWKTDDGLFEIANHANVFARQQMDIGARFLLQHLPPASSKKVVDLGCGNGVIGLYMLKNNPDCQVTFVDESYMAIASAKQNIEHNMPKKLAQCEFLVSNCLEQTTENAFDIVICNPPFHQQNTITDHIASQMFEDAKSRLKKGGELRIIGNRHLDYPQKLKRLFGGFKVVASDRKFSILSSFV